VIIEDTRNGVTVHPEAAAKRSGPCLDLAFAIFWPGRRDFAEVRESFQ
jgi:hypothetical protein